MTPLEFGRIVQTMADLGSPEAAPRLNAQVRLREEARNWVTQLIKEVLEMAGDNYTFKLPTEQLKTELEEVRAELARTQAQLRDASAERCPDPSCRNCGRWNAWYSDWGRDWYRCPDCGAGPGKPCWDKRAPQGQLVRGRPHQRRKPVAGTSDPGESRL